MMIHAGGRSRRGRLGWIVARHEVPNVPPLLPLLPLPGRFLKRAHNPYPISHIPWPMPPVACRPTAPLTSVTHHDLQELDDHGGVMISCPPQGGKPSQ